MGRNKCTRIPEDKKARTFSTSAIFKAHKGHASPRDARERLTGLRLPPIPQKRKHRSKPEHRLSKEFSMSVEYSRKIIEEKSTSQLNVAQDALISEMRSVMEVTRGRRQEVDLNTSNITRPLNDEILELTRKDGAVITTTLGKRLTAYRKLLMHEEKTLNGLFEQWAEVSKQMNDFATKVFGPVAAKSIMSHPETDITDFETGEEQELLGRLEAEKERVEGAATAASDKAMRAVKANEKQLKLENQQRMQQLCDSIFDEGDELAAA